VVYLKNPPSSLLPKGTPHFTYEVIGGGGKWVVTKLMPYLYKAKVKPDVLLSPSHYSPPLAPMPKVCSIMDLGYLENLGQLKKSDFWQLKYWTAISIRTAKRVLAISKSTKDDIVRHYPSSRGKVEVTHLAYDSKVFSSKVSEGDVARVRRLFSIGPDYILYLGVLKPSKNLPRLIQAWSKIVNEFPQYKLVIAGKKGWFYQEIFESVMELELSKDIIFTDYIKEDDKAPLMKGAKLFVLPSVWEGFGLDVLNAMAVGTPVVLSNVGSLPEVAGDAGVYFEPCDEDDIAAKIKKVLSMKTSDYNELVKKSLNQVKKFSWESTARKTLEVLERAAK
jgi:glycosyltransferase involved in cell wall biosynthesis